MESRIKPTPCGQLDKKWNWKSGAAYTDTKMPDHPITRNYFDCGIYFFDGTFNSDDFLEYSTYFLDIKELENNNNNFSKELSTLVS